MSMQHSIKALVSFLDKLGYNDKKFASQPERIAALKEVYERTLSHVRRSLQNGLFTINDRKVTRAVRTSVQHIVYCWSSISSEAMLDLCIYFVYICLFDDLNAHGTSATPSVGMSSFFPDLFRGGTQHHPFWRLMLDHLPHLFRHYGSFCQFAIYRGTLDWYQGCWIEAQNFLGYPGAADFPQSVRQMNTLGHVFAAALFTKDSFDDREPIEEVSTMMAQLPAYIAYPNDLLSFYKEQQDKNDKVTLVSMSTHCKSMNQHDALEIITKDAIRSMQRLRQVFSENRVPGLAKMVETLIQGYVTWHFCDDRYQLREVCDRAGNTSEGAKFRAYFDQILATGMIDPREWT